jgi:aspartate aminotransferase
MHLHVARLGCLKTMSERVIAMRKLLFDELVAVGAPGTWDHILKQRGLFTYTGLTRAFC